MVVIFGKRTVRIHRYIDNHHICYPCKAFDHEVSVYQSYFHFCLIPVFPISGKQFEIRCRNCGDETRLESILKKYDSKARTPIYLYSALILIAFVAIGWFYWNRFRQEQNAKLIGNPAIGDVYIINEKTGGGSIYYFLRVVALNGDSVMFYHNTLNYPYVVSGLEGRDYFEKNDTVSLAKKKLKDMLDEDDIYSIKRGYGDRVDFNRIK